MKIPSESESRQHVNAIPIYPPFREEFVTYDNGEPQTCSTNSTHAIYTPLPPSSLMVSYQTVPMQVHNCRHVIKAIFASTQSVASLTNILGSYLACKVDNEMHRQQPFFEGPYRLHSKPEVQRYNHLMNKLEVLSGTFLNDKRSVREGWEKALGSYRRQIFAELCFTNKIVRCFSRELPDGPFSLPRLSDYALGIGKKPHNEPLNNPILYLSAPLAVLSKVRTVILLDDSCLMTLHGHLPLYSEISLESRWEQARRIITSLVTNIAHYSCRGIDLHFSNQDTFYSGLHMATDVQEAFNVGVPQNGTPIGIRVNDILDAYMCTLRYYRDLIPLNFLILTDGEANDEETLHWTLEEHLTKLINRGYPAHQLGIEFVQLGDCKNATRQLDKLKLEVNRCFKRDIIGVTPTAEIDNIDPDRLLTILANGIYARVNGYRRARSIDA